MQRSGKAVAAGILLTVGLLALWVVLARGPSVAFADVLRQLREIQTVKYKRTVTVSMGDAAPETTTSEVIVVDAYRQHITDSDGTVHILDSHGTGHSMILDPRRKKVTSFQITNADGKLPHDRNLLAELTTLDEAAATPLGRRQLEGKEAEGFRATISAGPQIGCSEIWVDIKSRLPVLIETDVRPGGALPSVHLESTGFEWNIPVDPSLVDTSVPAGYSVASESVDLADMLRPPTDAELIGALKTGAEVLNGGRFLPDQSLQGVQSFLKNNKEILPRLKGNREQADRAGKLIEVCVKMNPRLGTEFHYAGANVPLGQPDTPIFWYQPKGSMTYHVIYADLSVKDAAPDKLPRVKSAVIQATVDPSVVLSPAAAASQP